MTARQARQARGVAQRAATRRAVLAAIPGTYKEIMVAAGLSWTTVRHLLVSLRDEQEIHIASWQAASHQGKPCPVHARGAGEDAPFIEPDEKRQMRLLRRREKRHAREAGKRLLPVCAGKKKDRMVPSAISAQRAAFPLAGVWA